VVVVGCCTVVGDKINGSAVLGSLQQNKFREEEGTRETRDWSVALQPLCVSAYHAATGRERSFV
jgi:hypothetical protein